MANWSAKIQGLRGRHRLQCGGDGAHRLGRKLADARSEAEKSVKDFERIAKQKVEEVIDDVKSEAQHLAEEVRNRASKK